MMYVLIPRAARAWTDLRIFNTYAAAEQVALRTARILQSERKSPDWCEIVAYEGIDELHPTFVFTLVGAQRLHREEWPTPSS